MRVVVRGARTRFASGRFLFLGLLVTACQTVGGGSSGSGPEAGPPEVIVSPGPISRDSQAEAAQLWFSAQRSAQARRLPEALRTLSELIERFPASDVSGDALRLSALTEFEIGDLDAADRAAERYLGLLGTGDPRAGEMRLLQAAAMSGPAPRLDRLLRVEADAAPSVLGQGEEWVRAAMDSLSVEDLQSVVDMATGAGAFKATVLTEVAVRLLYDGDEALAAEYAMRAIDWGARGEDLDVAQGVLVGVLPARLARETTFSIGVVLPLGGSPSMSLFATGIAEGIELAAATVLGDDFTVTVVTRDDEGDAELSARGVVELEAEGVTGIVGLLQDGALIAGALARTSGIPVVSPTARSVAQAGASVYSLEGADPEAARAMARYAASRAFQRVAMVYPNTPEAVAEADAFEAAAFEYGIAIVGRFSYEPGATFVERQLIAARDSLRRAEIAALGLTEDDTLHVEVLQPVALFLPIPPEDVELLAPQVIHFALDTLAIEILGTSGWTDPQTLAAVDARHTTGVVATAPAGTGAGSLGQARFRRAYEEYFRRSLVGTSPAVGYDAALLLLEALRPGRIRPDDVATSFQSLEGVEGATGVFSIVGGRVVRLTNVVRIENRIAIPIEVR